ncbi:MAG: oxidoreductase [Bacteriovoracaceae bacterium]
MKNKKVILITGASAGIGHATAKDLILKGHIVYCAARSTDKMEDLKSLGGHIIKLDITKEEEIQSCVDQVIAEQKKIDVLWNNAGFGLYGSVEETSIEDARYQFEVNLFGLARITQLITPYMREQKKGLIINTSSMAGKVYTPLGAWYHGTKHALEGFSDCLRFELAPFGIDVVLLEPGAINTEFGDVMIAPMVERSGHGPYKKLARAMEKAANENYSRPNGASPVSLISKTVQKIIDSKKPKTRYLVGKYAKPMVGLRRIFGDRVYDCALKVMVKA